VQHFNIKSTCRLWCLEWLPSLSAHKKVQKQTVSSYCAAVPISLFKLWRRESYLSLSYSKLQKKKKKKKIQNEAVIFYKQVGLNESYFLV